MFIPMFILCNYVQQICRLDPAMKLSKGQFLVEFWQSDRLLGAPCGSKVLTRSAASRCASFLLLRQAWCKPLQVSIAVSHVGMGNQTCFEPPTREATGSNRLMSWYSCRISKSFYGLLRLSTNLHGLRKLYQRFEVNSLVKSYEDTPPIAVLLFVIYNLPLLDSQKHNLPQRCFCASRHRLCGVQHRQGGRNTSRKTPCYFQP